MNEYLIAGIIIYIIYEIVFIILIKRHIDCEDKEVAFYTGNFTLGAIILILQGIVALINYEETKITLVQNVLGHILIPIGIIMLVSMKIAMYKLFVEEKKDE